MFSIASALMRALSTCFSLVTKIHTCPFYAHNSAVYGFVANLWPACNAPWVQAQLPCERHELMVGWDVLLIQLAFPDQMSGFDASNCRLS